MIFYTSMEEQVWNNLGNSQLSPEIKDKKYRINYPQ